MYLYLLKFHQYNIPARARINNMLKMRDVFPHQESSQLNSLREEKSLKRECGLYRSGRPKISRSEPSSQQSRITVNEGNEE